MSSRSIDSEPGQSGLEWGGFGELLEKSYD